MSYARACYELENYVEDLEEANAKILKLSRSVEGNL
jgi:hypothetical protein